MTTFSGKKIFITDADCRVGRVVGKHFKASGCVVHGLRTCREDLDFADESWFADYVVRAWRRKNTPPHNHHARLLPSRVTPTRPSLRSL